MQHPSNELNRSAEAARYALLRRLSAAMRHQMAGNFQPVTMLAAIVEKRLKAVAPDVTALAKTSSDVRALASAATRYSIDLMGWIACDPEARVPLDQGLRDALHLVATELSFRGFRCLNETEGVTTPVARNHVRGVVVAGVLALTDAALLPANLRITAQREGDVMVVTLALAADETAHKDPPVDEFQVNLATYRKIDWADVKAIAAADSVRLEQTPGSLVLRLPVAEA